jgi:hypothetical protein
MVGEDLLPSLTSFRSFFKLAFDCGGERIWTKICKLSYSNINMAHARMCM